MAVKQRTKIEPKVFLLVRHEDESGVSGTGIVAYGVMFDDRTSVVHWCTEITSTTVYVDIDDIEAIHGHGGKTVLEFIS